MSLPGHHRLDSLAGPGDLSDPPGPGGHVPADSPGPASSGARRLALADAIAGLRGDRRTPDPALADAIAGLRGAPERALADAIAGLRGDPALADAIAVPRGAPASAEATRVAEVPPPEPEGARLPTVPRGAYEVAHKFAQGGIGRILKARDPVLDRTVALKELLVAGQRVDEERFLREVLLTARLQHPGIVPVYAAGRWPSGEPFYAMKLVSGRSFDRVIAEAGALAARLALLPHVLAIAETVAYAHAQGIIHRDLKPGNVLVGEFGETVVIDWGLAKQIEPTPPPPPTPAGPEDKPTAPDPRGVPTLIGAPPMPPPRPEPTRVVPPGTGATPHDADRPTTAAYGEPLDRPPTAAYGDRPPSGGDRPPPPSGRDLSSGTAAPLPPTAVFGPPAASTSPAAMSSQEQLTHVGAVVGTPGYMSPEQADGGEVDARTDVYALGAILYHTLCGRLPYDADNAAMLVYKTVFEAPVPLQQREPQVPEELVAVVEKAMHRRPAARYPTAKAFADDLRRFQTGQIVGAHRYSAWELLVRVLRRYRTPLAVAGVAVVVVIVVIALSFAQIREERDRAEAARGVAEEAQAAAESAQHLAEQRADSLAFEQARLRTEDDPSTALRLLDTLSPAADWRRIRHLAAGVHARGLPTVLYGHTAAVSRAVFSPDSTRLVTTSDDCTMRLWDLSRGTSRTFHGHTDEVWRAAWSPDQRLVATTSRDRTVRVWDLETGDAQVLTGHEDGVRNIVFAADGRLYTSADDLAVRRWDLAAGTSEVIDRCSGNTFPWSDRQISCLSGENAVHIHDLQTGERTRLVAPETLSHNGAVSPDGRWAAAGTETHSVRLWNLAAGTTELIYWPDIVGSAVASPREMRFAPASDRLGVPLGNHFLAVWDLSRRTASLYRPHAGYTRRAVFSSDGALIASVGGDNTVKVQDPASGSERSLVGTGAFLIDVQFSRDGRYIASVGNDPRVFVWPERTFRAQMWRIGDGFAATAEAPAVGLAAFAFGRELAIVDEQALRPRMRVQAERPVLALALTPDGALLFGLDDAARGHVWDARSGALLRSFPVEPSAGGCSFQPALDGRHVLGRCGMTGLWIDLQEGRAEVRATKVRALATVGPADDELVLLGGEDGRLVTWQPRTDRTRQLHDYSQWVRLVTAVPGRRAAIVASERNVDLWDLTTGKRQPLPEHRLQLQTAQLSDDGRVLATTGRDNLLRVYDLDTLEMTHQIHPGVLLEGQLVLSRDGGMLAAATTQRTVLVWDLRSSEPDEPRKLYSESPRLTGLRFLEDALLALGDDGRIFRWDDDLPRDPDGVRRWVHQRVDPDAAPPVLVPGCAAPVP
jgi:WD40 repeat protein/serine/threonine protein kinase